MTPLFRGLAAFLATFFVSATLSAAGDQPIVTSDLLKLRTASQIDVAPDGSRAVYVVTSMVEGEAEDGREHDYQRHLWLVDLDGDATPRQLTHGERNDTAPAFSPDGKRIAFARRSDDARQVWILPLDGGEAFPLTRAEHGAFGHRWSPDGKHIVFGSELPIGDLEGPPPWTTERPGRVWRDTPEPHEDAESSEAADPGVEPNPDGTMEEVRAWLADNAREDNPRVLNRLDLQGERELDDELSFEHLFVVDARAGAEARQLTDGYRDFGDADWLPDGSGVVAISVAYPDHPDRVDDGDLWHIPIAAEESSEPRLLLDWAGWSVFGPRVSPDGRHVAFLASDQNDRVYSLTHLATLALNGDAQPKRYPSVTHNVTSMPTWSADSASLFVSMTRHGSFPLVRVAHEDGTVAPVVDGPRGVRDFDLAGNRLVFAATEVMAPWELYRADASGQNEQRLTALNQGWLADRHISEPTEHWLDRPDGTRVQYWVMKPRATDTANAGTPIPVVLAIHGGPASMWGPGEFTMWHEFQLLLSRGYGVVYANPRGSGGYGHAHRKANYRDWGHGPAGDVLAALDEAAKQPWVDRDQLVVTGGSYAGYLTAWIVTQDHRFKAAVAQRGVYELSFFFGEGNAWRLVPYHFGGYPWEPEARDALDANSPQTFVDQIKTPLLIIHSDQDRRTGVNQSEMLYKSLKVLERPVEYVRYPGEGHDLSRSGNPLRRMDRLNRIVEFFERYVQHPTP